MVLFRIDIHQVLRILKVCGTFTSTWPPASTAEKREIFLRDLGWTLGMLNVLASMGPLILGAWHCDNNIVRLMMSLSEVTALTEVLFNLILCRIGRSRLQVCLLLRELEFIVRVTLNVIFCAYELPYTEKINKNNTT